MVGLSGGAALPEPGWTSNRAWDAAGYAPSPGLRAVLALASAEDADVRATIAGPVVFAYSLALVAAMLDGAGTDQVLGSRPRLEVVVGVPDGEAVVLGVLTPDGLDRSGLQRLEAATPEAPDAPDG